MLDGEGAGIAQLVEHLICNQGVTGSNPVAGTIKPLGNRGFCFLGTGTTSVWDDIGTTIRKHRFVESILPRLC